MRWPLITRRQHETEVAALRRRVLATEARHDDVVRAHNRLAQQLAEADATNRRLHGRNDELSNRLKAVTEATPERAAALTRRVDRLRRIVARLLAEQGAEKKRADHLQRRLDDAMGLNTAPVLAGRRTEVRS
ncbi:hypothetical protein ACFVOR_14835 [Streptomyces sp. NPDC057837]|uniref:hypothetical protein n=1 Tax=Streptomyces sp. NPDC057837 TaxID=3346260 RepID=UPI00367EF4E0